jgi:hypothetical protein
VVEGVAAEEVVHRLHGTVAVADVPGQVERRREHKRVVDDDAAGAAGDFTCPGLGTPR